MDESETEESDREVRNEEERRAFEKKRKRTPDRSSSESEQVIVGMRAVTKRNGIFSDAHAIGRYISGQVGKIRILRVTRSGTVIIECRTKQQRNEMVRIKEYEDGSEIVWFKLGKPRRKGVISGVPLSITTDMIMDCVRDAYDARRMTRFREGKKELSKSICINFEEEIPERVYIDYVCYRVRQYEEAPLRCYCCQEYGHVAAVCRGERKCGRCGSKECKKRQCEEQLVQAKCSNCAGNHHAGAAQCPKRNMEEHVKKIRKEDRVSYAEAVRRMEGNGNVDVTVQMKPEQTREERVINNGQNICLDKKRFLAFIAMVINCAVDIQSKTERIKMILDAATRFLDIVDISGEDLDDTLRGGLASTQTKVSV